MQNNHDRIINIYNARNRFSSPETAPKMLITQKRERVNV